MQLNMDPVVAERMVAELRGTEINGWRLEDLAGSGKSALVFRGHKGGSTAAVKVFDRDMVQRFGYAAQRERVYRERKLIGKHHPNLVEILDAGWDSEKTVFFVVMEYISDQNLGNVIANLPRDRIHLIIAQIASAAEFLESMGLAHRDIKPENIGITSDLSTVKLLDLGVVRPIGLGNITDQGDRKLFVGTLRYSPPELLVRDEQDTQEGWRGVTFYQLGGVLHDMIMQRPLFAHHTEPFTNLVEAVRREVPVIDAADVPSDLRLLAANCLIKDPSTRLALVTWSRFAARPTDGGDFRAAAERIALRRQQFVTASPLLRQNNDFIRRIKEDVLTDISRIINLLCDIESNFPPRQIRESPARSAVEIEFAASPSFALPNSLSIGFAVEVLDASSKVVKITASAYVAQESDVHRDTPPVTQVVFEGSYSAGDILDERLKTYLFLAFDRAQEETQIVEDGQYRWLHVPGGE